VIKYLIRKNPGPLQSKDKSGLTALDYIMDNNELKKKLLGKADKDGRYPLQLALEGGASIDEIKSLLLLVLLVEADDAIKGKELLVLGGSVADKSADIDRLSYLTYAQEKNGRSADTIGKPNNEPWMDI
jgi:ankyrin repeat protein